MSKYAIAKQQLKAAVQAAEQARLDSDDVLEALIVTGIQNFIKARGGAYVKTFLQYEMDNISTDIGIDLQRR